MEKKELPVELVQFIAEKLIDFALAYHKSNNKDVANDAAEYTHDEINGTENPLTAYATKLIEAEEKIKELERWKAEAICLLSKIDDYADKHPEIKLGTSKVDFTIDRAMRFDNAQKQATGWRPLLEDILNDWNSSTLKPELKNKIRTFLYGE